MKLLHPVNKCNDCIMENGYNGVIQVRLPCFLRNVTPDRNLDLISDLSVIVSILVKPLDYELYEE